MIAQEIGDTARIWCGVRHVKRDNTAGASRACIVATDGLVQDAVRSAIISPAGSFVGSVACANAVL